MMAHESLIGPDTTQNKEALIDEIIRLEKRRRDRFHDFSNPQVFAVGSHYPRFDLWLSADELTEDILIPR